MDYYGDETNAATAASPGMATDPSSRPGSAPPAESFLLARRRRPSPWRPASQSRPGRPRQPASRSSSPSTSPKYDDAYRNSGFGAVGASGKAIASLPKTTVVGEESRQLAREKAECAVCLEGYKIGDALRTMPCNHDFHERCIVDWLKVSRMCPLCRFKLPPAVDDEAEESDAEEEGDPDADGASTC